MTKVEAMMQIINLAEQADKIASRMDQIAKSAGMELLSYRHFMPTFDGTQLQIKKGVIDLAAERGQECVETTSTRSILVGGVRILELKSYEEITEDYAEII